MKKVLVVVGILLVIIILIGVSLAGIYNRFVTVNESITGAWSEVENQLQRRNDLIPNLVSTVKGYAKHEKDVFENIANARTKLAGASSISDKIKANQELDTALSRLLMIVEQYPNLKANENFIRLQDELAGTENRIAVARQRYNNVVLEYNIIIKRFPGNIIASMSGFQKKDVYYKAESSAQQAPKVSF